MTGTLINAIAIVVGTFAGLARKTPMQIENQQFFKVVLGAATVFVGLRLTWTSIGGTVRHGLLELGIVLVAMMLGKLTGRLLRLQKLSNRLGQYARDRMMQSQKSGSRSVADGVNVCAALFCAAPLGILGAITEGLGAGPAPLILKSVMEALAAMSFVALFGWGVGLSALPVLALQGSVELMVSQFAFPILDAHGLVSAVNATAGVLIFSVSLVVFEVRRVEVADYLPSLLWAPALALWLK